MAASSRPAPRKLEVIRSAPVTRNMLRITLGGAGLDGFPAGQQGGYIKLNLSPAPGATKPTVRTYTIRAQREGEIDVDFALHGTEGGGAGPATDWAMAAKPGDIIAVGGPGPAKPLPQGADWYVVVGDMTALPAISVNLAALDPQARGAAVIEIMHEDDRQELDHPPGVEVHWLVNPAPGQANGLLIERVQSLAWPEGKTYAWSACEFSSMRRLKAYLHGIRALTRDQLYISSYWKQGSNEEAHKLAKREELEAG